MCPIGLLLKLALSVPLILLALAFSAVTVRGEVDVSIAVCIHTAAAVLILAVPAASVPRGPPPEMQRYANAVFACLTAIACHAVAAKWDESRREGATSRAVRRSLVIGVALVIAVSSLCQWAMGQAAFWRVTRLCVALVGALRLLAVLFLYHDGAADSLGHEKSTINGQLTPRHNLL